MNEISNLADLQRLLEGMEKDIQAAKQILQTLMGQIPEAGSPEEKESISQRAKSLSVFEGGRIIEGVFDGQNMVGPDGRMYPVPANYASKSKLVEGDVLKLTIAPDGSFIYKQIGPIERKRILGVLVQDEKGDYRIVAEGKSYKVLLASLTYYHAEPGDEVTLMVPSDQESAWAAVENVIKKKTSSSSTGPEYHADEEPSAEQAEGSEDEMDKQVRILTGDDDDI